MELHLTATRILLFDGVCNLCNRTVQFFLKHDKRETILFSSLQSTKAQELLSEYNIGNNLETLVYIRDGVAYTKSQAAFLAIADLGGFWNVFKVCLLIPKFLRDWVYQLLAKHRYQIFGRQEQCYLPTKDVSHRFL
jgi:predicted DCC family thiol-disulfide oxidoreductase YuxK